MGRKATWLYACGVSNLPSLKWSESSGVATRSVEMQGRRERAATPPEFRDVLLGMARSVEPATRDECACDGASEEASR